MVKINPSLASLNKGYLFPEIEKRKQLFLKQEPTAKIISLGIGDTTQPIGAAAVNRMQQTAFNLGTKEGYKGYGKDFGDQKLKEMISKRIYHSLVDQDEIFISDGAKCDCGRLLHLFGPSLDVAVQNPTYPVYVDTAIISGVAKNIIAMPCSVENNFFPDPVKADIIYLCSPNNPTGSVATKQQLKTFIDYARKNKSVIIFDAAYQSFITDDSLPRSIFEIEGSREVAIEVNSFSKLAGFTGLRLGWTVIPKELCFEDGSLVIDAWSRICSTYFNGASSIIENGGIAVLEDRGFAEVNKTVEYYLENAKLIKETFESLGYDCYGADHAPFVWVNYFPKTSWEAFEQLLQESHVLAIPGSGFGSSGEHFLRFSAFAQKELILEAMSRISHAATLS